MEKHEKSLTVNAELLELLYSQHDNYRYISAIIKKLNITTGVIFTPSMLRSISEYIERDSYIMTELLSYLDVVNFYSLLLYNDESYIINSIIKSIVYIRTHSDSDFNDINLNNSVIFIDKYNDEYMYSSISAFKDFLECNKYLLSIYIYSMVNTIFFINIDN